MLRAMSEPRVSATVLAVAAVVLGALASGCSTAHVKDTADYAADGKYGIGVHTFTFIDSARATPANGSYAGAPSRTLVVELWYPSTMKGGPYTDGPLAPGAFPLVLHSHGFMDHRTNEAYLGEHLATHGYLMAAPDFPLSMGSSPGGPTINDTAEQPRDLTFVLDNLLRENGDAGSAFHGAVDEQRIAASGLSLGGLTTLLAAFHPTLHDPRIRAAMALAAPSCMLTAPFFAQVQMPLLLVHGDSDLIVPIDANARRAFPLTRAPSELVVMRNGSHTGFAGPAAFFDQSMHVDAIGCTALSGFSVDSFASLGTAEQGISQDLDACPRPCQVMPGGAAIDATRQQTLAKALALGFFDAHLGHDSQGSSFVEARAAAENPELAVELK
jgi:predicted dienelactone hydrolase